MANTEQTLIRVQLTEERIQRILESHYVEHRWLIVNQVLADHDAHLDSDPFSYQWFARFPNEQQALLFILRYG